MVQSFANPSFSRTSVVGTPVARSHPHSPYVSCPGIKGFVVKIRAPELTPQTAGAIFSVRLDFVFRHHPSPFNHAGVVITENMCHNPHYESTMSGIEKFKRIGKIKFLFESGVKLHV